MRRRAGARARVAALLSLGTAAACAPPPFEGGPTRPVLEPPLDSVAAVVFLIGDAGNAIIETSPLVHHLRADVERTSQALPDSTVLVLFLGDNIYPVGLRDRTRPEFKADSARLTSQIWTVTGPQAFRKRTSAHFLAGNHDWGNLPGDRGLGRLRNQEFYLERMRRFGYRVQLTPRAGRPGPVVVDLGEALRVVLMDSHWWLQSDERRQAYRREAVLDSLALAIEGAGSRPVVVASHHPYTSAGPHNTTGGIFDPMFLLRKSGSIVQDLNAPPFLTYRDGLTDVFRRTDRPLAYIGGHDHSLQVLNTAGPGQPAWSIVSGAGSKLTDVAQLEELVWAAPRPGYMRLVARTDGHIDLYAVSAPESALSCRDVENAGECMNLGIASFRTEYSIRLR